MVQTAAFQKYAQLIARKDWGAALLVAEAESVKKADRDVFWLTRQIGMMIRMERLPQAQVLVTQAFALAPQDRFLILAQADIYSRSGKWHDALQYYTEILKDEKLGDRAKKGYLKCLLECQKWAEILSFLGESPLPLPFVIQIQSKALCALDRKEEAIDLCKECLKISPDHPEALWVLTHLEVEQDGIDAALLRLSKIARIPSRPAIYREIYAYFCKENGQPELAASLYEALLAESADPRIFKKQAFLLAKSGEEAKSIPMFEEVLRSTPWDKFVCAAYTAACQRTDEENRATQFYEDLLKQHPEQKWIYGHLKKLQKSADKKKI